jgi:hypothetical protein
MVAHRELRTTAQEVVLEYTSEVVGTEVRARINRAGRWVWEPDALKILEMGPLASCRGVDQRVAQPFFIAQPPDNQKPGRPFGPPKKEA